MQLATEAFQGCGRSILSTLRKHIFRVVSEHNGTVVNQANGFRPFRDQQIAVSTMHINDPIYHNELNSPRPSSFFAEYDSGERIQLYLEKSSPDLSILKAAPGFILPEIKTNLVGGVCNNGDKVYIFGCTSADGCHTLRPATISELDSVTAKLTVIDVHSEHVFYGALVANEQGQLLGVSVRGIRNGQKIFPTRMVYAKDVEKLVGEYLRSLHVHLLPSFSQC